MAIDADERRRRRTPLPLGGRIDSELGRAGPGGSRTAGRQDWRIEIEIETPAANGVRRLVARNSQLLCERFNLGVATTKVPGTCTAYRSPIGWRARSGDGGIAMWAHGQCAGRFPSVVLLVPVPGSPLDANRTIGPGSVSRRAEEAPSQRPPSTPSTRTPSYRETQGRPDVIASLRKGRLAALRAEIRLALPWSPGLGLISSSSGSSHCGSSQTQNNKKTSSRSPRHLRMLHAAAKASRQTLDGEVVGADSLHQTLRRKGTTLTMLMTPSSRAGYRPISSGTLSRKLPLQTCRATPPLPESEPANS